jgi:signal transduction histidine kinase/DNA-binding response OmpR family regulator
MKKPLLLLLLSISLTFEILPQAPNIDSLRAVILQVEDTARVNVLLESAKNYSTRDLDLADSLIQEALYILEVHDYPEGLIKCWNSLSFIRSSKGNIDEGFGFCEKAIQLSEKLGNKYLIADSYNHLFVVHFKKGDYQKALAAAEKSVIIAEEANSLRLLAKGNDNIGIIKGINGFHSEAIEYFMKSLQYFEEIGDEKEIAISLLHLGHTFELAGNYEKALEYLKRSLEINKRAGNKFNIAWALVNIGVTYSRLNMIDTALQYYERSLEISEQLKDQSLILTNLDNIGGKYSLMKDFEKANYYLQRAYRLSEMSGINSRTVYIIGNLAENYLYMAQFDSAKILAEKQLELAINSGLITEQKVAYNILSQVYDSLNDHESAYTALQNYIIVNDTIFNREKSMQVEELRENYEAEKKEQTIANLQKEKDAERFRRNTFAGTALIVLIIGSLLYNNQRVKNRKNKELLRKEQEVDHLKSQFFANITHEFRTPLTLILGPIEMMKSEAINPKIHQHLDIMKMNAQRLLDLINQLLELSKIESGSLKLNASRGNIVPFIKGIIMSFESIAQTMEIELTIRSSTEQIEIFYDREKLEKVFVNLLSNAIKFTPEKGKIDVELRRLNQNIEILIRDTGMGMPAAELDLIFNRFYQSEYSDKNSGTGIGLALAKQLIEIHHGSILVKSEENLGTEFIIKLPLDDDHLTETEKVDVEIPDTLSDIKANNEYQFEDDNIEERESEVFKSSRKPLLLLIEDNVDVRNYIVEILESDYQLLQADDGVEGIEEALKYLPDIIISDVMMPNKDGYEVCNTLKQNEITNHIPIILLTAKVSTQDKIQGLENQADDYLTKPFIPKELLVRVKNLIDSRRKLIDKYQRELILRPSEVTVNSVEEKFVQRLIQSMEEHLGDEKFGVEELASEAGMSRSQLHRKMVALIDQSPNHFIRTFRLARAMELLKKQAANASEIAYQVGFSSPSYFTKCFRETYGYPPGEAKQLG